MSVALGCLALAVTIAETSVGAKYTQSVAGKNVAASVGWGVLFEAILLVDTTLLIGDRWLALPILVGAGLGIWLAVRR